MIHLFRLFSISWWALALAWAADGIWVHAAVTFAVGLGCHAYAEHLTTKEPRSWRA